jgi:hypothetical protein
MGVDTTPTAMLPGEHPAYCCPGYVVNPEGQIRNLETGHTLKPSFNGPYPTVSVLGKTRNVHQIIGETFHGPRPCPDCELHHGDRDKRNFAASNLEWLPRNEHRKLHGGSSRHRHHTRHGKNAVARVPRDFPLYPAPDGRWVRNVAGRTYYFGTQRADPRGVCALKDWKARRRWIEAGTERRVPNRLRKQRRRARCGQ